MSQLPTGRTVGITAGLSGVLGLGAGLLDNHYGFTYDIARLRWDRGTGKRIESRLKELGDDTTIYHMMELANPDATMLWFEGRSWTYAEAILGTTPQKKCNWLEILTNSQQKPRNLLLFCLSVALLRETLSLFS